MAAHSHLHPHLHLHLHLPSLPSLRGDPEGSPWLLLPGVALVLAAIVAVLIVVSFALADVFAGRAY